jgi:uncharacterized protein
MWIQTKTGEAVHMDGSFTSAQVNLEDIAHSLGMLCRYNGHCKTFYSVAEHSVNVWRYVRDHTRDWDRSQSFAAQRTALMHDAAEAYIGDIPTPLKRWLGPAVKGLEKMVMEAVEEKYGLIPEHQFPIVKKADMTVLSSEATQLFDPLPLNGWGGQMLEPWAYCPVLSWSPPLAKDRFLQAAGALDIGD